MGNILSTSPAPELDENPEDKPLCFIGKDMWWEIGRQVEAPEDYLELRATCKLIHSACPRRDFGVKALRCVGKLEGHTDLRTHISDVTSLIVFAGMLVSAADDCTIKFWEIESGKCLNTLLTMDAVVCLTVFGSTLVSGSPNSIKFWNVEGECVDTKERKCGMYDLCLCSAFHHEILAVSCYCQHHTVEFWTKERQCEKTITIVEWCYDIYNITRLLAVNDYLVTSSHCGKINLWNREGNCVKSWWSSGDTDVMLFADNMLITSTASYNIEIWDASDGWHKKDFCELSMAYKLSSLAFYKGYICLGMLYNYVSVRDLKGEYIKSLECRVSYPLCMLEFQGKLIIGGSNNSITIWDSAFPASKQQQQQKRTTLWDYLFPQKKSNK